jgi:hypothetical protein
MAFALGKSVLPDRPKAMRILFGPFRGAVVVMNPRTSLRKLLGIYEHELNPWLKKVLPRVTRVLDVGANDGYFTFGCAAAFRRFGITGEIIAFEPQQQHIELLRESVGRQPDKATHIRLLQTLVGCEVGAGVTALDAVHWEVGDSEGRSHALIKIDVEGAELEVLRGATSWLNPTNYFLVEVHEKSLLDSIVSLFASRNLQLTQVSQQPFPILGRELRSESNWWLISNLS